jgi:hypothetical protein
MKLVRNGPAGQDRPAVLADGSPRQQVVVAA